MDKPANDTIFALSSGRGPAAVAVIRISGPMAETALKLVTGRARAPEPRQAAFARIRHPHTSEPIDEALALWFPGPRSETGEDVVELQLHGGRAVIAATLAALSAIDGLRPAEAGEFTRRAFENGKLDLTAVEGLADLVMAETEAQRRQAYRQMRGLLGGRAEEWRRKLIEALALVEAGIDFSDEGDVPDNLAARAQETARALAAEIAGALADARRGERLREGLVVAIAGPPNAGKSTLLNRIARREAAIVSPYAGTTRDVIEVHLDLEGYPVTLLDTAGIRNTDDPVEMEGVRRARERAGGADLVLWVVDAAATGGDEQSGAPSPGSTPERNVHDSAARELSTPALATWGLGTPDLATSERGLSEVPSGGGTAGPPPVWLVRNKIDLSVSDDPGSKSVSDRSGSKINPNSRTEIANERDRPASRAIGNRIEPNSEGARASPEGARRSESDPLASAECFQAGTRSVPQFTPYNALPNVVNEIQTIRNESKFMLYERTFNLSALHGGGLEGLLTALAAQASEWLGGEAALVTRVRHRQALEAAKDALERATADELDGREDLIAEELRLAAHALDRLTGRVDVEDVLDVIFRDFCIGK